jgi:fumarate reductase flavoprotein subunit
VTDSPRLFAADIQRYNKDQSNPKLTRAICRESAFVVDFLLSRGRFPFRLDTRVRIEGHSAHRAHKLPSESGEELAQRMREAVEAHPRVQLVDRMPVQGLLAEGGAVVGITAGPHGEQIMCRKLVLACGGFGANADMVAQHLPELGDRPYVGGPTTTGDAIVLAAKLGAAVEHMQSYLAHCHVVCGQTTRLTGAITMLGGIMVNRHGNRFAAEDRSPPEFCPILLEQPDAVALEIFDQRIFDHVSSRGSVKASLLTGAVRKADTAAELADAFGIDGAVVQREVDRYNRAVGQHQDWLGRVAIHKPLCPPFYGTLVTVGLSNTQGGLKVDARARVLRADGTPIRNLFAAGDAAAGISGDRGCTGYLPGNGLVHALSLGAIAGKQCGSPLTQALNEGEST